LEDLSKKSCLQLTHQTPGWRLSEEGIPELVHP
jgi:hypothetical protein